MRVWSHEVYAGKKSLGEVDWKGKRVFVRVDYNVPLRGGEVLDRAKIQGTIPTLQFLLRKGVERLIIGTHLGRPECVADPISSAVSGGVEPVIAALNEELVLAGESVQFKLVFMRGEEIGEKWGVVQNLRTLRVEKSVGDAVSKKLFDQFIAMNCDIMVSDGFGVLHRKDYSVVGVKLEKIPGLLVDAEMQGISFLLGNVRPLEERSPGAVSKKEISQFLAVANDPSRFKANTGKPIDLLIIGGCKLEDKIGLVKNLAGIAANIFLGGLLGTPFLNKIPDRDVEEIIERTSQEGTSVFLPVDYRLADQRTVLASKILETEVEEVRDIGEASGKLLGSLIKRSQRVFWNGTLGMAEKTEYEQGTKQALEAIQNQKHSLQQQEAQTMFCAGGGDTSGYIHRAGYTSAFDFVFTGGGATLEALEGKILPGIDALADRL
ncbi:phosphoglycerate kinase [Nematocida homosporus]|uniref:phosphoglycerate kinase n=1 Tax=Nematocida homosporus TaxID=1912981 RepID=UPI00221EEE9E|nr:phosphoglycerate kinase [Nematocida homosporus]KAI5187030.1 phosphoglycerate kinase [Nematocida homosporus]